MIIILDGPDGTGKTTLAERMCTELNAEYLHLTYRWKERIFDYHTAAIRYAARKRRPIVIDRWWPSEAVYSKAFRGGSDWPLQGRMCDRVAKKFGVIYVYCLPDDVQSAVANHAELKQQREEMYEDIEAVAVPVLTHRVITNFAAESQGMTSKRVVERLIEEMRED